MLRDVEDVYVLGKKCGFLGEENKIFQGTHMNTLKG